MAAQEELLYSEEPEQVLGSVKEPGLLMSSLIHFLFLIVNHNFFYSIAFTPLFSEFRKTKYTEKFSLANGLTQDSVLGWKLEDLGHSHEVQDALASNPQCRIFFPDNSSHLGFQFMGIQQGMLVCTVVSLLHLYHFEHRCSAFLSLSYDPFGMNFNQSLKQVNSTRCRGPSWSQTLAQ